MFGYPFNPLQNQGAEGSSELNGVIYPTSNLNGTLISGTKTGNNPRGWFFLSSISWISTFPMFPVTTCLDPRFNSLVDWLVCSLEIFPGWNAWTHGTVDGRNPAPVGRYFIPLFSGFHTSQVVQDFFYQQYDMYDWLYLPRHIVWGHLLRFAIQRPPYRPKHGSPQEGMTGCLGFSCISLTFMVNY